MSDSSPRWPAELDARYDFVAEAGRGGMGVVYQARDRETGEVVAIKVLKPDIAADRASAERFVNEVRLARRITHKHVCRVHDFSRAGSTAFLTMEFVEGESLRALVERLGAVAPEKGIRVARQICAGLAEAHGQGIVHRDLKPENVMLDRSGNVRIMDFGIARLLETDATATVGIMGTPAYMAPEQAEGRPVDARTDIYALGLILYELFTGRPAFSGDTAVAVALKQIREAPTAPSAILPGFPPALEQVVMRCLEKDPAARFQSADELDAALAGIPLAGADALPTPAAAQPPGHWPTVATVHGRWTERLRIGRAGRGRWAAAAVIVAAAALAAWAAFAFLARPRGEVPFTTFTLGNGLQVILAEDRSAPTIGLGVTYRVGSRDDRTGRAGFAHLFEHMMFNGSLNVGKGEHQSLISTHGGLANGVTHPDMTQYWQTVPSNQLDMVLFLEADRMRSLRLDQNRFEAERATVSAEIQQRVENAAYGRVAETLYRTAYDVPQYRRTHLGSREDLAAATLQEVADFFRVFYAPNNAVLTLAGDFDPAHARRRIEHFFEHIPAQPPAPVPDLTEPPQTEERRATLQDPFAPLPQAIVAYKAPPGAGGDWEALHVLLGILGEGTASRLQRRLVRELEVAVGASTASEQRTGPGLLYVNMAPAAGRSAADLLAALDGVVQEVRESGVTQAEVDRVRNGIRLARAAQLQQNVQRALLLGDYEVRLGGTALLRDRADRLAVVTPSAVQAAAAQYLLPSRRTVVDVTPGGARPDLPPVPAPAETVPLERLNRAPVSREIIRVPLPSIREVTLENGLRLQIAEQRRAPLVSLRFDIRGAGPGHAPATMPAVSVGVSAMLREGTSNRTSRELAERLEILGVGINAGPSGDPAVSALTATGLAGTFDEWFPIVVDMLRQPTFPADELALLRNRLAADRRARSTNAVTLAAERLDQAIYGAAAARPLTPEDAMALTADALRAWHQERYAPQHVTLTVAGAVRPADVERLARTTLGDWTRTTFSPPPLPAPDPPERRGHVVARPGSVQASFALGVPTPDRLDPDFLPLVVINRILGGTASSRLFVTLREERGLTYGATSTLNAHRHGGDWRATAETDATRAADALSAFLEVIEGVVREPLPQQEFDDARRSIVAGFAVTTEQLVQVVGYLNTRLAFGLSADYWDRYPEKLMAITPAEAHRAAQRYLDPARLQIVVVGEPGVVTPVVATHAPVEAR